MEGKRRRKIARAVEAEIGSAQKEKTVVDGNKNDGEDYFRAMRFESPTIRDREQRWFTPAVKCGGNVSSPPPLRENSGS